MPARSARPSSSAAVASSAFAEPEIGAATVPAAVEVPPVAAPSALSGYRGLKVWQRAMDLAAAVHVVAKALPAGDGVLADAMRAAAIDVPTQIAAGNSLYVRAEYVERLSTAHGSAARLECLLQLADRLVALPSRDTAPLVTLANDVARMLRGLARALQAPKETEPAAVEAT